MNEGVSAGVETNGASAPRRVGPLSEWTSDRTGEVLNETVGQILARQLPLIGDRPAMYWPEDGGFAHITFGELADRATRVAKALVAAGATGGRIAAWGGNTVEYVILEYASALAGAAFVPFNTAWTDAEVCHAVELTNPVLIFAGMTFTGDSLMRRASEHAPGAQVVSLNQVDGWAASVGFVDQLPDLSPDAPLLIQFTSGTTGRAKGAVITHRGALNGALQRNRHDAQPADDLWLNPVPYFHIGGSCFVILGALLSGGAFVVLQRWSSQEALRLMRLGMVTRLGGVPTMLIDILEGLGGAAQNIAIHSVSLGGATVEQSLVDRIRIELGAPTLISYGQSECPLVTSTSIADDPSMIGGTIGRPLPGAHVRIVDSETGRINPIGMPGEIQVRSPNVMSGYWGMPTETAATMTDDGFLRTGDVGEMDEHGYIVFRGRSRDVIIRGGENVYPAEVEELLVQHPGVAAAVLVGVDDARLGERVAGVIVRAEHSTVTAEELADHLRDKVARFKVPAVWRFVEGYPMTASGKIRRFVVRDETNEEVLRDAVDERF